MCGIAGYVGPKKAPEVLFDMLKRLEYRGYDSAGIAYIYGGRIHMPKDRGKVDEVRERLKPESMQGHIGVGHTRWATHGIPSQVNSHPHGDCTGDIAVAHNGIIENHVELKAELEERGHTFKSETDTEVIAHLIEGYYDGNLLEAVRRALEKLRGSYAIAALSTHEPDTIVVARNESPLLVGLGKNENYVASDAPAFLAETRDAVFLDDMEYGKVTRDGAEFYSLKTGKRVRKKPEKISWNIREAEKSGYHHFMLKEIHEEPQAAANALKESNVFRTVASKLADRRRIYFVACGTAYHAGLYGRYLMERFGLSADAVIASEFRYSTVESVGGDCAVIAVSQSGETADTIAAVKEAKKRGAYVASIVNVVGSSLTRVADDTVFIHAGPEIAVASTKAYVGQLVAVARLALEAGHATAQVGEDEFLNYLKEIEDISEKIEIILKSGSVRRLAEQQAKTQSFFYVGRRENYPTALEGALKLKEISYVHAEGYPAGELKHGPLALMDESVTVIALMPSDELREKVESNVSEIRARGAKVIAVPGREIKVPKTNPLFAPILNIVPLHLFAYYISVLKGLDPDKPRNLAKSVTVE